MIIPNHIGIIPERLTFYGFTIDNTKRPSEYKKMPL